MQSVLAYIEGLRETKYGGIIITSVIFIILIVLGVKLSDYITNKLAKTKEGKSALHWKFIKQLNRVIIVLIGLLGVVSSIPSLDKLGTTVIASSSVVVAALGLASQESLANAINGMFITIFKPFVVGDRVRFSNIGVVGIIEDITLRHTVIRTFENNRMIIPNTTINKENIENYNYVETKVCNYMDIKVTYDSDFEKAREILKNHILQHPLHIDVRTEEDKIQNVPEVKVLVRNLSEIGVELRVGVWASNIGDSFQMCSDIRGSILSEFKEHNIKIASSRIEITS